MDPDDQRPLDYQRPGAADRFERDGWIGLVVTLVICAVAAFLFLALAKPLP